METTHHDVIKLVPRPATLGHQRCRRERTQHRAKSVETMKKAKNLIRVGHVASPGVPSCVFNAITKTCNDEDDHQNRVGRMQRNSNIRCKMAKGSQKRDSALAESNVNPVVEQRSTDVTSKGRQENQRDDDVSQIVVFFKVWDDSLNIVSAYSPFAVSDSIAHAVGCIVRAHDNERKQGSCRAVDIALGVVPPLNDCHSR